jgi:hypothetical protein
VVAASLDVTPGTASLVPAQAENVHSTSNQA